MIIRNSYLIFEEDFETRNWIQFLRSIFTDAPPPHRYNGALQLDRYTLQFSGYDLQEQKEVAFSIDKSSFTQLYYGYDGVFSKKHTWGISSKMPIRMRYVEEGDERSLYLVAGFLGFQSQNQALFEELKRWLS